MKKSFVIDSVTSFKQVNSNPLNRSKSKNLWSFSKDERFKKPVVYCEQIYNIPSAIHKRGAGFGYGKKTDFTKDLTASPRSTKYNLKTIFDKNRQSQKGFSIYAGRQVAIGHNQKIPDKGYIKLEPLKFPSPNKYNNSIIDRGHRYSMRMNTKKFDKTMSIQSQNSNPGVGSYNHPATLSPKGQYPLSKNKGSGATTFNPRHSTRFFKFQNQNPGPGKYNEVNNLSPSGSYISSRSIGKGKRYFDKEKRVVDFERKASKNIIPGPGAYRSPSDFGHYDGDVYNTISQSNKSLAISTQR